MDSDFLQYFVVSEVLIFANWMGVEKVPHCGLCILWFTNDAGLLFLWSLFSYLLSKFVCVCVCTLLIGLQEFSVSFLF